MRDDYLQAALKAVNDPNILVNVVSQRVKQLQRGSRPLVESLERLSLPDTALREIAEGKISFELASQRGPGSATSSYPRPVSASTPTRKVVGF